MNKYEIDNDNMAYLYKEVIYPELKNAIMIDAYIEMLDYIRVNLNSSDGDKTLDKMLANEIKSIIKGLQSIGSDMKMNMSTAIIELASQEFINKIQNNIS